MYTHVRVYCLKARIIDKKTNLNLKEKTPFKFSNFLCKLVHKLQKSLYLF